MTAQDGGDQKVDGTGVRDDAETSPENETAVAGGKGKLYADREAESAGIVCGLCFVSK